MSKVAEVTLAFWVIKIVATTLGETGGDAVSMTLNWGYALSSALFVGIFVVAVAAQIAARSFHSFLYWAVIIATTTAGTTMADLADRSLGIGYPGGSLILFALLMTTLGIWYWRAGSISVDTVSSPRIEMFYWATILFSQTLGTALGDWMADTNGLGYERGALVFTAGLIVVAAAYKPVANGGLAFGRFYASAILAAVIVGCIALFPQRAGRHPGAAQEI
jgi:uncharacterized membrane-anchored protein